MSITTPSREKNLQILNQTYSYKKQIKLGCYLDMGISGNKSMKVQQSELGWKFNTRCYKYTVALYITHDICCNVETSIMSIKTLTRVFKYILHI